MTRARTELLRFITVGGVAFITEMALLWWLIYQAGLGYFTARLVAFSVAISMTFAGNARYTFSIPLQDARLGRYILIQLLGATINLGLYTLLVYYGPLAGYPLLALACGATVATIGNFLLSRRYVYSGVQLPSRD